MTPAQYLYDARYAFSRQDRERGVALCETILREFPDSPEAKDAKELLRLVPGEWAQAVGDEARDNALDSSDAHKKGEQDEAPPPSISVDDTELQVAEFYAQLKRLTPHAFVTPTLVLINVGVFAAMIAGGVDLFSPSIEHLLSWGANYAPKTTSGEWWRLLTSNYVHIGLMHIALNMYVLWDAGRVVERLLGNVGFIIMYVLSGVLGSFTSVLWNPLVVSAGASGAVFGVYGCLIGFLLLSRGSIPDKVLKHIGYGALAFVAYNVFYAIGEEGIDMAAHVGGLATGFLCGVMMRSPLASGPIKRRWARNGIVGGIGAAVIALAIGSGLGHVADVEGALLRFGEVEEQVFARLNDTMQRAEAGELSDAQVSVVLNQRILAPWRAAREAFERTDDVPIQQKPLFDTFVAYMTLKEDAFRLLSESATTGNEELVNSAFNKFQEADQIVAELEGLQEGIRMAAEQGDAEAQYSVGLMYANGRGVAQDYVEAYAWIDTAEAQGHGGAVEALQELRGEMTPSQLERALELAREYRETYVPQ